MFRVIISAILMVGVLGSSWCDNYDEPKACGRNNCVWFQKECVACEQVTRMISCRNKPMCFIANGTCHTYPSYVPTPEPTMSPSVSPTTPEPTFSPTWYGKPCVDYKHRKPCNRERHCRWNKKAGYCCSVEDPNARCASFDKRRRCRDNGCEWDKDTKKCT